ncbi:aspartic proteinase-like protein 2 isoform X2 [Canna indica]|uniref:Aspartic proteinase-like protein 2 isoform X2 n=1 Tax=Canna indica TaxID=4628 RepID=A0AAQ3Q8A9_9LILI|nr:aspartic proteinase-like protein 2 isoform X2 [Canna indica]
MSSSLNSCLLLLLLSPFVGATGVFKVRHKFQRRRAASIADLRTHDDLRHSRMLAVADLPLGGVGAPTESGLYYSEIGIGTPRRNFYVQVDTGSDHLWVNCFPCATSCPKKNYIGLNMTVYDPNKSSSRRLISCQDSFCLSVNGEVPYCLEKMPCDYSVRYGDGSSSAGFYVEDVVQYNRVSRDHRTKLVSANVTFGCGAENSGDLGSHKALDGLIGFGKSNISMISQLAASGKVSSRSFSHCLDSTDGGGIFVLGQVVEPKMNVTPFIPNRPHYAIEMKGIEVGGSSLELPAYLFSTGYKQGAIIDSGTTLAYLPELAYMSIRQAIFSNYPNMSFHTTQGFDCFKFYTSVDDGFPEVVFHFEKLLMLNVYPHDYFFQIGHKFDHICDSSLTLRPRKNKRRYVHIYRVNGPS